MIASLRDKAEEIGAAGGLRSIPEPSFEQETLVPDNSFSPVPAEAFTTTAGENGLGDTAFYADGEIVSRSSVSDYDTIQVSTEAGDLYVSAVLVDFPELSEGETVTVYFVYTGWSDKLGGASDEQRTLVRMLQEGFRIPEIADILGMSQQDLRRAAGEIAMQKRQFDRGA